MNILIDDRAGSKELIRHSPLNKEGELCRLESGDALIVGNGPDGKLLIGVEVKSITDLISSMSTGRLQATQIPAMLEEFDISWLLHYGRYRPSSVTGGLQVLGKNNAWRNYSIGSRPVPYGYVESMLLTLSALGIKIKRVSTEAEAARWIGVLSRWWQKDWKEHKGMRAFDKSRDLGLLPHMNQGEALRAKVAAQLPGIGFERALLVAKHFHSVSDMVQASVAEWENVEGIGKVIAKAVRRALL